MSSFRRKLRGLVWKKNPHSTPSETVAIGPSGKFVELAREAREGRRERGTRRGSEEREREGGGCMQNNKRPVGHVDGGVIF